ncbi:phage/plasmid primase, P4 family [Candidatus Uabimicrobium amorphum]|uniref:Primase n=1 Tax=Uabimicrobium amorphum TaxID=2596890 RepID=A0A5S9F380_UABAM|nr:phage/plasmid primase, P4 family [Candidatus Uabimicrobium amorphum]BBM84455.1 primase [Candidatus Uabimicrobium amorphum]
MATELLEYSISDLQRSGLNQETIQRMRVYSLARKKTDWLKENLGFAKYDGQNLAQVTSEIMVIPYQQDFVRVKLFPQLQGAKYLSPKKGGCWLYYLDGEEKKFHKAKKPIILTEGEKKCAKLTQEIGDDFLCLGSAGISTWNTRDWQSITLKGREVYIAFDRPNERNPDEEKQLLSLFLFLWKRGAIVYFLHWPEEYEKVDDWLTAVSSPQMALKTALDESKCNDNCFTEIAAVNHLYLAQKLEAFKYDKNDITILWDRFKVRKHTAIGKGMIKAMVEKCRVDAIREESPEWIEVSERGKQSVIPGLLAKTVLAEYGDGLIFHQSTFWTYDKSSGIWVEEPENGRRIKAFIQHKLGDKLCRKSIVEDVYFQIQNYAVQQQLGFDFDKNKQFLNLQNGVLDLTSMEMREHDKDLYFTSKVNTNYVPEADCPKWKTFLWETELDEATLMRLQEWFGYCLIPDTRIEKALYLMGPGGNGKTVIVETLQALLKEYSCSLDLSEIFGRFNTAKLRNKMVNICSDNKTTIPIDDRVKNLISGGRLHGEFKGRDGFYFDNYARLVFAANDFIPTKDRSHGFYRRFDIIEIAKTWSEEERNENLKYEIWEEELPGVLNWALEGLQRLQDNNFKMTKSQAMNNTMKEFREYSNPLLQFVNDCCEIQEGNDVLCMDLYEQYALWCSSSGHKCYSASKMGKELKKIAPKIVKKKLSIKNENGFRPNYYTGIKLIARKWTEQNTQEIYNYIYCGQT